MNHYSEGYYTIDFYDPNGFIVELPSHQMQKCKGNRYEDNYSMAKQYTNSKKCSGY